MRLSRIEGAFLGLAVGDALGAPLEFLRPDIAAKRFGRLSEMVGNSTWNPGEWTDDTAMALGVARGILAGASGEDEIEKTGGPLWNGANGNDCLRSRCQTQRRFVRCGAVEIERKAPDFPAASGPTRSGEAVAWRALNTLQGSEKGRNTSTEIVSHH